MLTIYENYIFSVNFHPFFMILDVFNSLFSGIQITSQNQSILTSLFPVFHFSKGKTLTAVLSRPVKRPDQSQSFSDSIDETFKL